MSHSICIRRCCGSIVRNCNHPKSAQFIHATRKGKLTCVCESLIHSKHLSTSAFLNELSFRTSTRSFFSINVSQRRQNLSLTRYAGLLTSPRCTCRVMIMIMRLKSTFVLDVSRGDSSRLIMFCKMGMN